MERELNAKTCPRAIELLIQFFATAGADKTSLKSADPGLKTVNADFPSKLRVLPTGSVPKTIKKLPPLGPQVNGTSRFERNISE